LSQTQELPDIFKAAREEVLVVAPEGLRPQQEPMLMQMQVVVVVGLGLQTVLTQRSGMITIGLLVAVRVNT